MERPTEQQAAVGVRDGLEVILLDTQGSNPIKGNALLNRNDQPINLEGVAAVSVVDGAGRPVAHTNAGGIVSFPTSTGQIYHIRAQ